MFKICCSAHKETRLYTNQTGFFYATLQKHFDNFKEIQGLFDMSERWNHISGICKYATV